MSDRKPETYACIQAWDRIAEDHNHARQVTLGTIERLTKRIKELEERLRVEQACNRCKQYHGKEPCDDVAELEAALQDMARYLLS